MYNRQHNIALISANGNRTDFLSSLLKDSRNRLYTFDFRKVFFNGLIEQPLDLVVVDCSSLGETDFQRLLYSREQEKLSHVPFLFIIAATQEAYKRQLYKNPYNKILPEPFDKFVFFSVVGSALHLRLMETRNRLYEDIIEGEKTLISHMDDLLEINHVLQFEQEKALFQHLEKKFVRRLELALAVETALFASYKENHNLLTINIFDDESGLLIRKHSFSLKNSAALRLLNENYSQIFEKELNDDCFVQELEEALGIKIFSLLFIPLNAFHKPKGAFVLVNKIYRDEFSENDLAFGLIAAQKVTYHLEKIYLQNEAPAEQTFPGQDQKVLREWQLFSQIMDSVNFGTVVFDETFRIQYQNKAALSILNLNQKKSPHSLKDLFSETEFNRIRENFNKSDFPLVRKELQLQREDTPHYYIGYSIYVIRGGGGEVRYVLVFSEISQTKRIQAEIIRMDRMASLGALSSGIAHEIRNPLAGIKAMAQTLEEELEGNTLQLEYVERILRQVNRLDSLLRSFFTYASPVRPDPSSFHIRKIIQEIVPLIGRKLMEKKIKIKENYAEDLAYVFVDSNQIEQVFLNLFLNAIDSMPDGGALTVTASNAKESPPLLDRRKPAPGLLSDFFIEIKVTDSGQGIPPDSCDRIFTPFYTTKSDGTGLGLSIVYQIIREHGGRIDVQSEVGKGTEFTILLPALENS